MDAVLQAQGIALPAGRAAKIAAAMNAPKPHDPLRGGLPFEADPTSYEGSRSLCGAR